jgi:hypothetical protein
MYPTAHPDLPFTGPHRIIEIENIQISTVGESCISMACTGFSTTPLINTRSLLEQLNEAEMGASRKSVPRARLAFLS